MIGASIALEASSWIGTRFIYAARTKKTSYSSGGCDCVGLVVGVSNALDLHPKGICLCSVLPKGRYPKALSRIKMLSKLHRFLYVKESLSLGAVVVFAQDYGIAHLGIITGYNCNNWFFVHAYIDLGMVVESSIDKYWGKNLVGIFSLY
ncbi:hypothetical protein CAXC1_70053 [Candidatus Xenohaliotis californiensis]|uniref:NlpC/P60 domain-containing protein n=1 Tax=Candidatus Xenohaliotis californiensis TaxID=84677 RepID=A0ABM9N9D5_9RICK|nr:hypothetical protein CAXC1_70053 [Candidatus Xenohaliotis californiensis]